MRELHPAMRFDELPKLLNLILREQAANAGVRSRTYIFHKPQRRFSGWLAILPEKSSDGMDCSSKARSCASVVVLRT